ncbi:MAG TPA: lysophospholipid acyltransferase family protein [Candidatus Acidoferrales bacterium]|nr:lysophospholipid acyltransferase family protein [Candidatus Acidoferrales bacterium]
MIYAAFRLGVRLLAWVVLGRRLRIVGMEHIPRRGAVLVIGNHVGTVEPALTGVFIPRLDVFYLAKSELFRSTFLGWLFRKNHAFPVVRGTPDRSALRVALQVLADGHVLLVYPEGTRSWDGQIVGATHGGAGFIARHSGSLVVPVASWGSEHVIPRGTWLPRRADVEMRIGAPFRLPESGADGRRLSNREAAAAMMERVIALLPEEHRPVGRFTAA